MEVDTELDAVGVILESQKYCAHCMIKMEPYGRGKFRCPICQMVYYGGAG